MHATRCVLTSVSTRGQQSRQTSCFQLSVETVAAQLEAGYRTCTLDRQQGSCWVRCRICRHPPSRAAHAKPHEPRTHHACCARCAAQAHTDKPYQGEPVHNAAISKPVLQCSVQHGFEEVKRLARALEQGQQPHHSQDSRQLKHNWPTQNAHNTSRTKLLTSSTITTY
jgi:hypothetical protein